MPMMLDEIFEQPRAISAAIECNRQMAAALAERLRSAKVRGVVIAARGTSDHAATYAKYLIEITCGIPVSLAAPSVSTLYGSSIDLSGFLAIGISQSGQATDVVQTIEAARASGAITACITNREGSPLTDVSDFAFLCSAGEEKSVAATKTYTTTLAIIALIASLWSGNSGLTAELAEVPDLIQQTLSLSDVIAENVERYRYMEDCAVLARGLNQATAQEAALKMIETSYLLAKAYSMADFLHGPIAMVSEGFPCLLYAPSGKAFPSMVELAEKLKSRHAEIAVFAHDQTILDLASRPIRVPVEINELLSPILYIVPGQLWACHLSLARGHNPDAPRGLSKVTLTR